MANISKIKLPNNLIYDIKDNNAAPLNSPILTGNPTAPTPSIDDTSEKIATTEFVKNKILSYTPIIISTINLTESDTLLCNNLDAEKLSLLQSGQLVFIILTKATLGINNINITNENNISKNIYLNNETPLCADFDQGNILGLIYINNNLYMINTPNFATGVSF